jgi:phosphoadenosine phosphosulfate reductase
MRHMTTISTPIPDLASLAATSRELEHAPASRVVAWAWEQYGDGLVLAASFQDCVLIDIAVQAAPEIEVVFLDTGYHFAETLWYVDQVRRRYDLNLNVVTPAPEITLDDRWQHDPDGCCAARKVEPLQRALDGKSAWLSGLRRTETAARANAPIVSYDVGRGLVKVNPLATWSDLDVKGYARDRDLPVHPLTDRGYVSIGCWPCTAPVQDGDNPREGRWAGSDKTECGLHA